MRGIGTDEAMVINIIARRSVPEIDAIKKAFHSKYNKDLEHAIRGETSGHFQSVLLGCLKDPRQYDVDVIHTAMKGLGTDEKTLLMFLAGRNESQKAKIRELYSRAHGKSLDAAVAGEFSGDLKKLAVGLCHPREVEGAVNPDAARGDAERLYKAGEGKLGTDENTFIEIFTKRSIGHLKQTFAAYETIHKHHTIERAVESEFSGDIKLALLDIVMFVKSPGELWAEWLNRAMKGLGTNDQMLVNIIVSNREEIAGIKQVFSTKYHKSLWQAVNSETSGDYKKSLLTIIGN